MGDKWGYKTLRNLFSKPVGNHKSRECLSLLITQCKAQLAFFSLVLLWEGDQASKINTNCEYPLRCLTV